MAIITQKRLFCWRDVEGLGDLERLALVIENIPDEPLMRLLEAKRGTGRGDYPVRAIWNSLVAMVVFEHQSVEALRRELLRNAQLRELCGFGEGNAEAVVPSASAYTRFQAKLFGDEEVQRELERVFEALVGQCSEVLPDFGENLGGDGKAIESFAARPGSKPGDRRGEHDADWGVHEHHVETANGTKAVKAKNWYGFKVHMLADTEYELPINFTVTPASANEMPVMHRLIDETAAQWPELMRRAEVFTGDRGLDDGKLYVKLWDEHRIKPIIDIRNAWRDGEETRVVPGTENVVYDYRGTVSCIPPGERNKRRMPYGGFEADRQTLKYRCPASHYGMECSGAERCPIRQAVRVPLSLDRRVFTPVARSSYRWQDLYSARTAVERVYSRLDTSFGFELHTTRGLAKMRARVTLAFSVMLAIAVGRAQENRRELMRSLVGTAA